MRMNKLTLIALASVLGTTCVLGETVVAGDIFAAINLRDMSAITTMLQADKEKVLAARTTGGITPLHYAASLDNTEATYRLLEAGVAVDIATENSLTTPLQWAADKGTPDTLRLLIKKGADVNAKAKNGYTPLHFLARGAANPEIAKYLLDAGADINALDGKLNTPLHIAAIRGNAAAVAYFVKAGANTTLKNDADKLAIDVAKDMTTRAAFSVSDVKPINARVVVPVVEPVPQTPVVVDPVVKAPILAPVMPTPAPETISTVAPSPSAAEVPADNAYVNGNATSSLSIGEEYRKFLDDPDTIKNSDGSVYKGEIQKNGQYHGFGVLCKQNRERYQGEWRNGQRHGVGTFSYSNGDNFSGSWKNGVPHGKGIYVFQNGGKVTGTWKNGILAEGEGQYFTSEGSRFYGYWEENKLVTSRPMPTAN